MPVAFALFLVMLIGCGGAIDLALNKPCLSSNECGPSTCFEFAGRGQFCAMAETPTGLSRRYGWRDDLRLRAERTHAMR
jgi:hypothetical protein